MCGIVGFVGARADMQEILQGMMDAIAHRGPDGQGQFIEGPATMRPSCLTPNTMMLPCWKN